MSWLSVLSDLFVNLAAGWLGAALIVPMATTKFKVNLRLLIINILCGILSLVIAGLLRR